MKYYLCGMKKMHFLLFSTLFIFSSCGIIDKGEKRIFGLGEIYFKEGVSAQEAENLGNFLYRKGIFDIDGKRVIQLVRKNDTLTLRAVTNENYISDSAYQRNMKLLSAEISSAVFSDMPVNTELISPYFNTKAYIPAFGRKILTQKGNYYYSYSMGEEKAASLFIYLSDSLEFFTNFEGSVLLHDMGEEFRIEISGTDETVGLPATQYTYKLIALSLARKYYGEIKNPISLQIYNLKNELQSTSIFRDGKWE